MVVAALPLLFFVAQLFFHSSITALLTRRSMKWNLLRNLKAVACVLIVTGAVSAIIMSVVFLGVTYGTGAEHKPVLLAMVTGAAVLFIFVAFIPLVYGMMKYIMEPDTKLWKVFTTFYAVGFRHCGFLLIVLVTVSLFTFAASLAVMLPSLVLSYAGIMSEIGVIKYGDPRGLPAYYPYLSFIISLITSFISLYINIINIFAAYYIYGSVCVRDSKMNAKYAVQ